MSPVVNIRRSEVPDLKIKVPLKVYTDISTFIYQFQKWIMRHTSNDFSTDDFNCLMHLVEISIEVDKGMQELNKSDKRLINFFEKNLKETPRNDNDWR